MTSVQQLWVGYTQGGGKAVLDLGGPGTRVLLLGSKAGELATLAAHSAKEAGVPPVVLDLDGSVARSMSGRFDTYDYRSFLYDAFRLEPPEAWHSQLAAAAYTLALDLSSEEEAIINAAMQVVASDGTLLSPVSVHDVMGKVEGFRGFYVDKLNGKIGALRLFDAVDDQSFTRLSCGNLVLDFHLAPYPLAAELAASLFLAKILAMEHSRGPAGSVLVVTDAHRIFRGSPRPTHSNRLLTHLLDSSTPTVFSSRQQSSLNPVLVGSCSVRAYSSDAWHESRSGQRVLSGSMVLHDVRSERRETFIPRRIPSKTGDYAPAGAGKYISPELTRLVLDDVDRFPLSTPESVVQYISPEFLAADVSAVLASLERQGCLILEPKNTGSGPKVFCYTLTEKGRGLLKELRG
jgi:hypothetical protein